MKSLLSFIAFVLAFITITGERRGQSTHQSVTNAKPTALPELSGTTSSSQVATNTNNWATESLPNKPTSVPAVSVTSQSKSTKAVPIQVTTPALLSGTNGFDGASFFGGFVLAIGMAVIGLVVYKVCFNRSVPSYSHF